MLQELVFHGREIERAEVPPQPDGCDCQDHGGGQQHASRRRNAGDQDQLHEPGTRGVADAVAQHVEERLHATPRRGVHRHEQQLVAAAVERVAQDRLEPAQRREHAPPRKQETDHARRSRCRRQDLHHAPAPNRRPIGSRGRLRQEGGHLNAPVEQREEPKRIGPVPNAARAFDLSRKSRMEAVAAVRIANMAIVRTYGFWNVARTPPVAEPSYWSSDRSAGQRRSASTPIADSAWSEASSRSTASRRECGGNPFRREAARDATRRACAGDAATPPRALIGSCARQ